MFSSCEHYMGENAFGAFPADQALKTFDKSSHVSPKWKLQGTPNIITEEILFRWFTPVSHEDSDKISHLS